MKSVKFTDGKVVILLFLDEEEVVISRSGGKFTIILGSFEITMSEELYERLRSMMNFVAEAQKCWA